MGFCWAAVLLAAGALFPAGARVVVVVFFACAGCEVGERNVGELNPRPERIPFMETPEDARKGLE